MQLQRSKKVLFLAFFFLVSCFSKEDTRLKIGVMKHLLSDVGTGRNPYLEGFLQDVFALLANTENLVLEVEEATEEELFFRLREGEIHAVVGFLPKNILTEEKYLFSKPILELGSYLIIRKGMDSSEKSFSGKIIGYIDPADKVAILQQKPEASLRRYASHKMLFSAVDAGEVDAVAAQKVIASSYINEFYPGRLFFLPDPLRKEPLYFLFQKGLGEPFLAYFIEGMQKIPEETFERLEKKWSLTLR